VRIVDLSVPTGPGAGEPLPPTIEVEHLEAALAAAGHTLAPYDIVLLWTGAERAWDTPRGGDPR
jgi:Putative cyclase